MAIITTSTLTPATKQLQTKVGINLADTPYFSPVRAFANLALGQSYSVTSKAGDPASSYFDDNGDCIKFNTGDEFAIALPRPAGVFQGKEVDVICRWHGTAHVAPFGSGTKNAVIGTNETRFTYVMGSSLAILKVTKVDPASKFGGLDVREVSADPSAFWDADYLKLTSRFNTIRFMDWMATNKNQYLTWANRKRYVNNTFVSTGFVDSGKPVEVMIDLANKTHCNPWFNMSWNADDDYIRKFATLVRDTLDKTLVAYVETSNEVWNYSFAVATQSMNEGVARNLNKDKYRAGALRYCQRTSEVMKIWEEVFAGQMNRIVRVISWQMGAGNVPILVGYSDTASHVDAYACAPYFGTNLNSYATPVDTALVFTNLKNKIDSNLTSLINTKKSAQSYGKRLITYEGCQGVTGKDLTLLSSIEHDARMGELVKYYLMGWQQNIGDLNMIYNDYGGASQYGYWGLLDNPSNVPTDTTKGAAVAAFMGQVNAPTPVTK